MNNGWTCTKVAAAVAFVLLVAAGTIADEPIVATADGGSFPTVDTIGIIKRDTTKCTKLQGYCSTSCADSTYSIGVCREGTNGPQSAISVECCCCTDGAEHRYFIGG